MPELLRVLYDAQKKFGAVRVYLPTTVLLHLADDIEFAIANRPIS